MKMTSETYITLKITFIITLKTDISLHYNTMNYNALKHYLKKINSHLPKNLRGVFNDTTEIRLFHNGHFVFTLPGLAMLESLNIKKQENGLWHVYCSERNSISDLSIFNDEDRACDYFISELHTFWPLSTFKGAVIYPALVINGITLVSR